MSTIIICVILAVIVFFAARHVYRQHKSGGCSGCSGCSGSCSGCHSTQKK